LKTNTFSTENGLSKQLPGADLVSNFKKGPTPQTASYIKKRNPVFIKNAIALSNNAAAYKSFDDNELTEWSNDGKISTGRITYALDKPSIINECVVKLTGWRSKSYPIRILADGKEVFKGNTLQSLGYITLDLIPILAKEITIELTGINSEKDTFNKIIEVDPTKELDLFKDKTALDAKGQLRIVEIEFYEN
jgi:hypothetical protein